MVFLNNLLSLPLILGLMVFYGELPGVVRDPALRVGELPIVEIVLCMGHVTLL